jgi:hypothetical protein
MSNNYSYGQRLTSMSESGKYDPFCETDDNSSDTGWKNNLITINIAIVGDANIGKSAIINFWLISSSENINTKIVTTETKSKIIWIDNSPVQLNISEYSSTNINLIDHDKIFHVVIYVYDINTLDTLISIEKYIDVMKSHIIYNTMQIILGTSPHQIDFSYTESEEIDILRKTYATRCIGFKLYCSKPSEQLSRFIGEVTTDVYDVILRKRNISNESDISNAEIEMDIFNTKQSLLRKRNIGYERKCDNMCQNQDHINKDIIYWDKKPYRKTTKYDCCTLF